MDFECQFVCELSDLVPVPALTIRTHTSMHDIGAMFDAGYREITGLLERQGKKPAGSPFARYYDMSEGMFDVEFGFPVEGDVHGAGRVSPGTTPSGKAAGCLYIGSYDEIEPAYDALMKWAADNGYALNGEACEIYLNDSATTPPDQLRTQLYLMLREG